MKIGMVSRPNEHSKWGGDLKAIYVMKEGFEHFGHEVELVCTTADLPDVDHVIIANTSTDLRPDHALLQMQNRSYSLIAFHEDSFQYYGAAWGFYFYVRETLNGKEDLGYPFSLDRLFENPLIIHYYGVNPRKTAFINYDLIKDAKFCIANSHAEAVVLKRDCPRCNSKIVYLSPGFGEDFIEETNDEFLKFTGLKKSEYILQVGRFEVRKNQLASILATKDLDIPLVFIATKTSQDWYEGTCLEAIRKWRKAPTYIISNTMPTVHFENIHILSMPNGQKLSTSMLHSAFANAGIHLHPAFHELPGYTYLESAKLGIPTIASSWTTIADYFTDHTIGKYTLDDRIEYCVPYDLNAIKALIIKKMGQKFPTAPLHPIFYRSKVEVASEILEILS